jgi:membrane protease YdiL (CAAX protease family)
MTEPDPDAGAPTGAAAPARPPGPVPEGYVPHQEESAAPASPGAFPAVTVPSAVTHPPNSALGLLRPGDPGVVPATRSQAWRWFLFALAGFLVGQIVALIFGSVAGSLAGKSAGQMKIIEAANVPPEWYVVSTLLGLWVGFIGAPWLASRAQGTRHFFADLGVRFRLVDLLGIAIGVGGQLLVIVLYAPFQHDIHNFNAPSQKLTGASHGSGFLITALCLVIFAPMAEEIFFRGLLFKALVRLFTPLSTTANGPRVAGVVVAVVVDGLLFGLAHGEWVQLAGLAIFGAILATTSYRTGRLGMNMVAHSSFNLVAVLAILAQRAHH